MRVRPLVRPAEGEERALATSEGTAVAEGHGPSGGPPQLRRPLSRRSLLLAGGVVALVAAVVAATTVYLTRSDSAVPVGDLPGWRQVFVDDFETDAPLGSFPGDAYGDTWSGYEGILDTAEEGTYSNARAVSVSNGILDMYLRTEDGTPLVAAPIPLVHGSWQGQTYGRYSVRFRADRVDGYKTAWLLWPTSNEWAEGEIDFPEGPLDGEMYAANLQVGQPGVFDLHTEGLAGYDEWHVATIEWTPDAVTFFLDGDQVAQSSSSPSTPMRWVLQTETDHAKPPASASGHVEVDWVAVWEMD